MFFKIHSREVEAKPALKPEQNWAEFLVFCHFAFLTRVMFVQVFSKVHNHISVTRCTPTSLY